MLPATAASFEAITLTNDCMPPLRCHCRCRSTTMTTSLSPQHTLVVNTHEICVIKTAKKPGPLNEATSRSSQAGMPLRSRTVYSNNARSFERRARTSTSEQCATARASAAPASDRPTSPRVRSHCRFRNRSTEYVRKFDMKWISGSTKRQCDRARTPPRRIGTPGSSRPWARVWCDNSRSAREGGGALVANLQGIACKGRRERVMFKSCGLWRGRRRGCSSSRYSR
jgi:hypothetical protein